MRSIPVDLDLLAKMGRIAVCAERLSDEVARFGDVSLTPEIRNLLRDDDVQGLLASLGTMGLLDK